MTAPDWQVLRVVLNDRAAIFSESFPGALTELGPEAVESFTHQEAQGVLYIFAGAWPTLGRDARDSATRFVYLATGSLAYRLRGVELAAGAIVVDDIASL